MVQSESENFQRQTIRTQIFFCCDEFIKKYMTFAPGFDTLSGEMMLQPVQTSERFQCKQTRKMWCIIEQIPIRN